ncbi:AT-rich binding protein-like [Anastrepha obliqua]|uniref:AT-rich binding protein-like n=1 Tax=Anastrepha obliqua TaxID=95512 RepID=UPI002409A98A|nr:AT-rich binding protein-like [Anastrepha obliqua]
MQHMQMQQHLQQQQQQQQQVQAQQPQTHVNQQHVAQHLAQHQQQQQQTQSSALAALHCSNNAILSWSSSNNRYSNNITRSKSVGTHVAAAASSRRTKSWEKFEWRVATAKALN